MKKNVGSTDAIIRIVLGVVIILLGVFYESWWGLVGLIPLITAFTGRCGLYYLTGTSTCKTDTGAQKV